MKLSFVVFCVLATLALTVAVHENEQADRVAQTLKGNCHPVLSPCQVRPKIVASLCNNSPCARSPISGAAADSDKKDADADADEGSEGSDDSEGSEDTQEFSSQHITTKTISHKHADGSHTTTTITAIPRSQQPAEESTEESSEDSEDSEDSEESSEEASEEAPEPPKKRKHLKVNSNIEVNIGGPSPNMPKPSM